ncbi:MAG: SapC family protein [Pseudomonadota bacterium]
MIDSTLFEQPQALDRVQHRSVRIKPGDLRYARTAGMNALFLTAVEFSDACREYPIVFVDAGKSADGQREVAPMAVLGLQQGENLMLRADGSWAARYTPALLRGYPFGLAQVDGDSYAVCIDAKAAALSTDEGERLFDDAGEATPFLVEQRRFVEEVEREAQRTRLFGRRLLELDLLRTTRFDATTPDGQKVSVDGFLALDEERLGALPDATVLDLHKSGVLALIHAHRISLGLMRVLVERRLAQRATA